MVNNRKKTPIFLGWFSTLRIPYYLGSFDTCVIKSINTEHFIWTNKIPLNLSNVFFHTFFYLKKMRNFSISEKKIISVEAYKVVGYRILRLSKGLQVQIFIFSWAKYESPKMVLGSRNIKQN
jgi:hypothetical protein